MRDPAGTTHTHRLTPALQQPADTLQGPAGEWISINVSQNVCLQSAMMLSGT